MNTRMLDVKFFCTRHGTRSMAGLGEAAVVSMHVREAGHEPGDCAVAVEHHRARRYASSALLQQDGTALVVSYEGLRRIRREKRY